MVSNYMNLRKITFLFLIFFAQYGSAQITIGSDRAPVSGALLQLKQNENIGGANSMKGMTLPRVALTVKDSLIDIGITDKTYPKPEYSGMVVYNVASGNSVCLDLWDGIYVWVDSEWTRLSSNDPVAGFIDDVGTYQDMRDPANPEEYKYREFGNAGVWMLENMRALVTPNGIPLNSNVNAESGGWLYSIPSYVVPQTIGQVPAQPEPDPNLVPTWTKAQGILYNWAAATVDVTGTLGAGGSDGLGTDTNEEGSGEGARIQGICPSGWHIPSEKEWVLLENEIIKNTSKYTYTESDISKTDTLLITTPVLPNNVQFRQQGTHGPAMTEYCSFIDDPDSKGKSRRAVHGGFAAVPAGYYTTYQGCISLESVFLTTSSQSRKGSRWFIQSTPYGPYVGHVPTWGANNNQMFYSVRCKKD